MDKVKFCISTLNEYISDDLPGIQIEQWFVEFLFNKLFEEGEEDIKYECSWIIINLSFQFDEFLEKILIGQEILQKMIDLIGKLNNRVTSNILYITGNMTAKSCSKTLKEFILNKTDFKQKLLEYLHIVKPNFVRRVLLWNVSNIVESYNKEEKETILKVLNEEYLKSEDSNRAVLREALIIMVSISDTNDEDMMDSLYKLKIHHTALASLKAISEGMEKKDIILQIKLARLITNMTLGKAKQIKDLLCNDFVEIYEEVIKNILSNNDIYKDYRLLTKEICHCLANLVGTNESLTSIIIKDTRLCPLVFKLDDRFNDNNIKNEIVRLFHNALDCGCDKIKFELLRLPVIEYFLDSLKIIGLENISLALDGLKYLLDYGKEIKISYDNKDNIVKRQIESLNGVKILENCADSENKEVSANATEILNQFFSKDESNKLNN